MASYYPSFTYMGINSLKDKHLRVVAFDADSGEHDTFLGMDPIYTEKYDGTRRIDYGAKFNSVAVIKISVIKLNKTDFTVAEVRDFLKWTTGVRQTSYLDLMSGDMVRFSFLGRVTNAYQQKIDSRTIGLTIEFTSISPWAYSPIQYIGYPSFQVLSVDDDGTQYNSIDKNNLVVDDNGILYDSVDVNRLKVDSQGVLYNNGMARAIGDEVIYINTSPTIQIHNGTDDLYTPVYLNTIFTNDTSTKLSIKNMTLGEETIITNISKNEEITLNENQFILSDKGDSKIFGNTFNFVWPRLGPGTNTFKITGDGNGSIKFSYRYPIKIGDCAIDMSDLIDMCGDYSVADVSSGDDMFDTQGYSGSTTVPTEVSWSNITNTPTTLEGYGITNAYTMTQVDEKISDINVSDDISINEEALNSMLNGVLDK